MRVTVAIIPPEHVLDQVEAALARTPVPPGELAPVAGRSLMLPVFSLGNVTRPEAGVVVDFLRAAMDPSVPAARVGFAGVWALEAEGDPTIALPLTGDVDRVQELARTLSTLVARHGYFVDRRRWAPRLTVGSVTATTTLPFLERLVADLAGLSTATWAVTEVAFVRPRFDATEDDAWEVFDRVAVGSAVGSAPP